MEKRIFSAMRPTGRLHIGHLVGAIDNWLKLQRQYECIFGIVDWHAYMGEYEQSRNMPAYVMDMAVDWMACGIDPEKSVLFIQSHVPEHLELFMLFSCITPLGWLERNPTYKEQLREITTRDLQTYGFLGYPVLQAADIFLYKANAVPIGEDQLPHLELAREIGRRFNHIYKTEFFEDCDPILTESPRLLGLDNRKMSKSYDNAIYLSDTPDVIEKKIKSMITDPARVTRKDPGHPDICNVYQYYKIFNPVQAPEVYTWCSQAQKGCIECKGILAESLKKRLEGVRQKREDLLRHPQRVEEILMEGGRRARKIARATMEQVKDVVFGKGAVNLLKRETA